MHNPLVPETLEGWSVLHRMYRLRWDRVKALSSSERRQVGDEAAHALAVHDTREGASTCVQVLGHKADLMIVCFRRSFDALGEADLALSRTKLADLAEPTTSYVSIVELGMYDMTAKIHQQLGEKLQPGTDEFERAFDQEMQRQRDRVNNRLFQEIPQARFVCFYPMNKRRGEAVNWYSEAFDRRAQMMREHGLIGRQYAGQVTQIISGSIGLDDWEWGVDLFAADPLVFKKLIYEMRFDEASAKFAEFGPFYVGMQFAPAHLGTLLDGQTPPLS